MSNGGGRIPSDKVKERRDAVKDLWLKGKTTRKIAEELFLMQIVNPITGEQYNHTTIANDIKKLEEEYEKYRADDLSKKRAISFAKLERLEMELWDQLELARKGSQPAAAIAGQLRDTLKDQRAIYGMDAPKRQQILGEDEGPVNINVTFTKRAGRL